MIVILEPCVPPADLVEVWAGFEIAVVVAGHRVVAVGTVVVGDVLRSASVYRCQCRRAGLYLKLR
jgi:hypothetical protein